MRFEKVKLGWLLSGLAVAVTATAMTPYGEVEERSKIVAEHNSDGAFAYPKEVAKVQAQPQDTHRWRVFFANVGAVDVMIRQSRYNVFRLSRWRHTFDCIVDIVDDTLTAHRIKLRLGDNKGGTIFHLKDWDANSSWTGWADPLYVQNRNRVRGQASKITYNQSTSWDWFTIGIIAEQGDEEEEITLHK